VAVVGFQLQQAAQVVQAAAEKAEGLAAAPPEQQELQTQVEVVALVPQVAVEQ
jgi:hypothetical protein